jgi:hypothetical protein
MSDLKIPQYFLCPITQNIMNEPVIDNEGNSYDKKAIEKWLENKNTSPITRNHLCLTYLKTNRSLKDAIEQYIKISPPTDIIMYDDNDILIDDENIISMNISSYNKSIDEILVKISIDPIKGIQPINMDIVIVVDVSGSMNSPATVEQNGFQINVGFTLLDITKHAIKTIIETMNCGDRISIIAFSDTSTVICKLMPITKFNKEYIKSLITNLKAYGCTNLWAGINCGLKEFIKDSYNNSHVSSLLIMTDGIPSSHLLPPRGILNSIIHSLSKMKDEYIIPTIYTFGFGYSIDTKLLVDIATLGNGTFSFIPDSGFVGTVIIHALANISTICGSKAKLTLKPMNGAIIKHIYGYDDNVIPIDTIHYGQSKDIVILIEINNSENYILDVCFDYISYNNNLVNIQGYAEIKNKTYNVTFEKSIMRLEFVELIKSILLNYPNYKSNELIKNYICKYNSEDPIITDLKDQVTLAISNDTFYKRWGNNYLYSLLFAHIQQKCNNFKDKSILSYGGELFIKQRDIIDEIYSNMSPPIPSINVLNSDNCIAIPQNNLNEINFGNIFNNCNNGCFHEYSEVLMADGKIKKCSEIIKGDIVSTFNNNIALVICVIKIKCNENICEMVKFDKGLMITPYHPIKNNNNWVFPLNFGLVKEYNCEYMYNYILNTTHTIIINDIVCVTLGHGFTDNDVIKHHYYGTELVINDLKKMRRYNEGCINFQSDCIIRDNNGLIKCFDNTKEI